MDVAWQSAVIANKSCSNKSNRCGEWNAVAALAVAGAAIKVLNDNSNATKAGRSECSRRAVAFSCGSTLPDVKQQY